MKATLFSTALRGKTVALTALALAAMVTSASAANLVQNGNFDSQTFSQSNELSNGSYNGATLSNWSNGHGSYNFVFTHSDSSAKDSFGDTVTLKGSPASGTTGNFVALDSDYPVNGEGAISQLLTGLTSGDLYTVSFSVASDEQTGYNYNGHASNSNVRGSFNQDLTVGFGSSSNTFVLTYDPNNPATWGTLSYTFTASGSSDLLSFLANGAPSGIPSFVLLDNISVTDTTPTSPTPEPGSLALLSTGLLGLGGMVRSRFKK